MKKTLFLFTCSLMAVAAHAKTITFDDSPRIISLHTLSFETIQELIHSKNSDSIIEFTEGAAIPLQFLMKNRVLSAMIDPNLMFKIEKTCYLRVVNKKCYMSEDLVHWEKAGRFMSGKQTMQIKPNTNKPGFTLETTIDPYQDEIEE